MMQSLCDTSPEVRQAAAYGVGVMAQFGGENYRPAFTGGMSFVAKIIHLGPYEVGFIFFLKVSPLPNFFFFFPKCFSVLLFLHSVLS